MKNRSKSKTSKETISQVVFAHINKTKAHKKAMKDTLGGMLGTIKRKFPQSKFKASHYSWYLSQYKKQQRAGFGTDRLHSSKKKAAKRRKK